MVRPTVEHLLDVVGSELFAHAHECVRAFGDFHVALSAGRVQVALAIRLMVDPAFRSLPWGRTHLWVTCERDVGAEDERGTFVHFRDILVDHAGMPSRHVHVPDFSGGAAEAAKRYERAMQETLAWRERGHDRLDYALLGLRGDGSAEGLLAVGAREARLVGVAEDGGGVSLTMSMVNATRLVGIVACGEEGKRGVERARAGAGGELGVSRVKPLSGQVQWYLDEVGAGWV